MLIVTTWSQRTACPIPRVHGSLEYSKLFQIPPSFTISLSTGVNPLRNVMYKILYIVRMYKNFVTWNFDLWKLTRNILKLRYFRHITGWYRLQKHFMIIALNCTLQKWPHMHIYKLFRSVLLFLVKIHCISLYENELTNQVEFKTVDAGAHTSPFGCILRFSLSLFRVASDQIIPWLPCINTIMVSKLKYESMHNPSTALFSSRVILGKMQTTCLLYTSDAADE